MDAILVKTLLFLLIFGLVEFIVVEGGPYQMENKNGTMNGRFLIGNKLKRAHDEPGFRKSVQKDCQNTYSKEFFPKGTPPVGLRQNPKGIVLICQQKSRNEFKEGEETYYTTLFDQGLGIPVYSAYRLKSENTDYQKICRPKWQENKGIRNQVGEHTYPQAPWQRGHLAPAHTLSSDKGAFRSTFRYTNAVPQRPSFNAGEWSKFERRIRKYAEVCTKQYHGILYLLSGTAFVSVDAEVKIDKSGNVEGVSEGGEIEMLPGEDNYHKIHVPKSLWTAGCCLTFSFKNTMLESFAVIGNNVNEPGEMHTQQTSVGILQKILEQDSLTAEKVNLFPKNPACSLEVYNLKKLPEYVKGDPKEEEEEDEEDIKCANGRAVLRDSTEKEENHIKLFRRSVHDPYQACFRQFFVNNQPPAGLRKNLNSIRYICQQIAGSQDVFYATMFDENQGIAVYAGYKLDQGTINFGQAPGGTRGWKREPGILRQGSDNIYQNQPFQRGHLVPAETYSSSEERKQSTYTHTNAVPQVGAFNGGQWSQYERRIRIYAQNTCVQNNGVLFLLTGTSFVQVQNNQLHVALVPVNHLGPVQNYPRIAIPISMWTAGCCVAPNGQAESFAVIGNNDANQLPFISQISLAQLQNILTTDVTQSGLGGPDVNLFPGLANCVNNNAAQLPQAAAGG